MTQFFQKYKLEILFFLVVFIACFVHNGSVSLWDQDEAAYAGFAKNMLESGNWLVPDFPWSDIHRKPPLHFWNIAISYQLFGMNEFSVRFPSALFIFCTYLLIFFWGGSLFGRKTAFVSSVVLATSLFVPSLAKVSVTDATVLFFSTICAFSVLQLIKEKSLWPVLLFWSAFALAALTKGPPILIFTSIFVFILLIFHPNRKNLIQLHPWIFFPLALLPLFIWGYLTTKEDGGTFINWMIDWYIVKRINGSVLGQSAPLGTHILLVTVFFLSYFMFFPKAIWMGIKGVFKEKGDNLLLGAWFIAGWLIYEFSPSKLPAYTIVAHVPVAILIGKTIVNFVENDTRPNKVLLWVQHILFSLLSIALVVAAFYLDLSIQLKVSLTIFSSIVIGLIIIAFRKFKTDEFFKYLFSVNFVFVLGILLLILPQIDIFKNSPKRVAEYIKENAPKESTIVLANNFGHPPSLVFYNALNFNKVITESNPEILKEMFQKESSHIFVLNEAQKEALLELNPNLEIEQFSSFFVDRKGKSNYFVVMN